MIYYHGSWKYGIWTFRYKSRAIQLKAPWNAPLFSERYGYYAFRIALKGWRIIYRKDK